MMPKARQGNLFLGLVPCQACNTVSLEAAISIDIDGNNTSTKKEGVAFKVEQSITVV